MQQSNIAAVQLLVSMRFYVLEEQTFRLHKYTVTIVHINNSQVHQTPRGCPALKCDKGPRYVWLCSIWDRQLVNIINLHCYDDYKRNTKKIQHKKETLKTQAESVGPSHVTSALCKKKSFCQSARYWSGSVSKSQPGFFRCFCSTGVFSTCRQANVKHACRSCPCNNCPVPTAPATYYSDV